MPRVHTNKTGYYGKGSVPVAEPVENEGATRRCALSPEKLVTQPFEGINTAYDVLLYAERTHGARNALGWRDIIDIVEEEKEVTKLVDGKEVKEKKKWKYFHLSDYKYLSFIEVREAVSEVARGLHDLGIISADVFNVYAQTRWVFSSTHTLILSSSTRPLPSQSQLANHGACLWLHLHYHRHRLRYPW